MPGCDLYTLRDYLEDRSFVPVRDITGIPSGAAAGVPLTLAPVIVPGDATNKAVSWAVSGAGATGASITGSTFTAVTSGTAVITARIANGLAKGQDFVKSFPITVTATFVPVEGINPLFGETAPSGVPLALAAAVEPEDATNRTVGWSIAYPGTTNASLDGDALTAPDAGAVTVRAVIINGISQDPPEDFVTEFTITILKTAAPAVLQDTVEKPSGAPMPEAAFTLTNAFESGTEGKAYAAAEGDAPAPGISVAVSGSTLTLSHASDVPAGIYYVTATEPGKGESARTALTVLGAYSVTYHLNGGTLDGHPGEETVTEAFIWDGQPFP
ncbi:MAG: hypothetical protein LBR23_05895, partial [Spirochaetaceae bacterium]|nr:hypothetical protein [Spirochaetaceae bacterium]